MSDPKPDSDGPPRPPTAAPPSKQHDFLHRMVLMDWNAFLFLLLLAAIWYAGAVLLLIFACILFAVFLYELSNFVKRHLPVSRPVALALVVFAIFGTIGLGGYLMAPQISDQASRLSEALPNAFANLRDTLAQYNISRSLLENFPSNEQIRNYLTSQLPSAGLFFSGLIGILGGIAIITFVGIYLAAQPKIYVEGVLLLVPKSKRGRARDIMYELGRTLARWLIGKSFAMLVIGTLTATGLSLLGVPLALILGIIAGLLDFIPYVGPMIAGVPAVLIAFSVSPTLAFYTLIMFTGAQLFEGYLLQPLVERRMVLLPPALTILMQVLFGTLFGFIGVALATPIAAVFMVLVTMIYIQDVLGENVKTPSER